MKLTAIFASVVICGAFAVSTAQAKATSLPAQCLKASKIICISKTDRKVRLVENGKVVLSMDARFGDNRGPGFRTAEGSFTVTRKDPMSWSFPFKVYMPFAIYFRGGEAIHYSYAFKKDGYGDGSPNYASHGCVNTRDMVKIERLFNAVSEDLPNQPGTGTPVLIYH